MDSIGEYEGSVAPAFMATMQRGKPEDFLRKLPLRLGRIIKVHSPSDDANRNKTFYEYDVMVDDGSENKPSTRFVLSHCWMLSQFGGAADFTRWTARELQSDRHDSSKEGLGYGSRVLVLCINASSFGGIILGGIQHVLGEKDEKDKGHHCIWQFNGIRAEVDKNGELHLSYNGKSDEKGATSVAEDVKGTSFHLLADGGAKLHTVGEEQFLFVDHASHVVSIQADTDFKVLSNGTFSFESKTDSMWNVGASLAITSQGNALLETHGAMDLKAAELIRTTSAGVHLGNATDDMVKGTTYRMSEATLHQTMFGGMQTLFAGLTTIASALATAAATINVATVLHKIPVVGPILGSIPLQAAGIAIGVAAGGAGAAAGGAQTVATALQSFEAQAASYLSLKNRLD